MIWFIVRRLIGLIFTLWIVFTVSFLLMRAVPGGPYSGERNLPPEIEENIKHRYRLDLPLCEQYFIELAKVASGDFGMSIRLLDFNVNQVIAQGLPISAAWAFSHYRMPSFWGSAPASFRPFIAVRRPILC